MSYRSPLLVTIIAALGGFLFGYDTGVIGGSQLYFTEYFNFSETQQGWAVSSALYGCLIGALFAGWLSASFSRKYTLILSGVLFAVSAWGSGIPESLNALVIFRIIGGLGVGIASMTAPMYISEVSPAPIRGRMVSYYQLAVVLGFFIVFLATFFIGGGDTSTLSQDEIHLLHDYNVTRGWRIMFWSELIPAIAFLGFLFLVPHSPRWLLMKGRTKEAQEVLEKFLPTTSEAEAELKSIETALKVEKETLQLSVFSKKMKGVLIIGILLSIFQQVTGINAILYYGAEIFSNALGYGPEDALKQQLLLGFVNFIFTFIAIFKVDDWGRRPLLLWGTIGMMIGILTLGGTIYFNQLGILSLVGMLTFIGAFALSMGPVVWVLLSEIFPNRVRSQAMSIAVAAQWLFNALVANSFPLINGSSLNTSLFNGALPYFIFGILCLVTFFFTLVYIPETKGKKLEEMDSLWFSTTEIKD